jgi:hypothetical protein
MRPQLQRLLVAGGIPAESLEDWERVAFMANWGSLTLSGSDPHQNVSNRGLHVVVSTPGGEPTHYCKLRRVDPNGVPLREAVLLQHLCRHPLSAPYVPRTTVARDEQIEAQVAEYLTGDRLDRLVPQLSLVQRSEVMSRVLHAAAAVAAAARELPEAFPSLKSHVSVVDEAREAIELLSGLGISTSDCELFERVLREVEPLPAVAQHRDLWPKNVIQQSTDYKIVDFDDYGIVSVPLYDAFHLVLSVDDLARPRHPNLWLERLGFSDDTAIQMRAVLRQAPDAAGLNSEQKVACLLYYLIDVPVFIYQRGAPEIYWGRYRNELPLLASLIKASSSIGDLYDRLFSARGSMAVAS